VLQTGIGQYACFFFPVGAFSTFQIDDEMPALAPEIKIKRSSGKKYKTYKIQ